MQPTLLELLAYPFQVIRLGAYWNRIEPAPGGFDTHELDWQVDAAERAGKQIVLCVGALKTFGYPEFFVPGHHLVHALPEHTLIRPSAYPALLDAATQFLTRVVDRYRARSSIVAWQVEHEAVDPLGMEHSWRLDREFVEREVQAVRQTDPSRPILMNGFLPATLPVRLTQWWQTRDQGDSLSVAMELADVVGIDYYPRHALISVGGRTLYLDGGRSSRNQSRRKHVFEWAGSHGRRLMISEGQAEPWEAVTTPPNPQGAWMFSCPPQQLIGTYNECMRWAQEAGITLDAYLFWGAEYWIARAHSAGDKSYLNAFARILENT
jgi:Beta-galactosidase